MPRKPKDELIITEAIVSDRNITDFHNKEFRDFAFYTIQERAIPSVIDGFKAGARKILYTAFTGKTKSSQHGVKMNQLTGEVLPIYHHAPSALENTIVNMAAYFKDNLNVIDIVGQGGSLRDPDAVGASRYLSLKLSKYAKLYKVDEELLEYQWDEGLQNEPTFYLPIIPTVLTANTSGIAIGYAFSCFSYDPITIIDSCIEFLKKGKITAQIRPYVKGIQKDVWKFVNDRWESYGKLEIGQKGKVDIYDLPYDMTFSKFETFLNGCLDKGEIQDWKNYSKDESIHYTVWYKKEDLSVRLNDNNKHPLYHLKLVSRVDKDNLTVLDENSQLKYFEKPADLIAYFAKYRLSRYYDRKTISIQKMEAKIAKNEDLIKFIKAVIDGKLILANKPIEQIQRNLERLKISTEGLSLKVSKLTKEEYQRLLMDNKQYYGELEYIKNTPPEEMYLNELKALKKELLPDFQ